MRRYRWLILLEICWITTLYADASDRYTSKKDHFSIQPPTFFNKPKLHRERNGDNFLITMSDDVGTLFRVEQIPVYDLPENVPDFVLLSSVASQLAEVIRSVVPDTKILEQESLILDNQRLAQFYLFDFPKGSILVEMPTQKRFDSMRGILLFMENDKCIALSYQTDLTFTQPDILPPNMQEVYKRYRADLIDAANSFRFENLAMNKK